MSERTESVTRTSPHSFAHEGSYVDWSAILSGAVVASGIAFVFTTFGAALGLTMVSPYEGDGSGIAALIAVGSWMLWTTISSFMVGGYIAGRMRRRIDASTDDEASVRDGIHGLAVWGVAILLGVFLLGTGVDRAAQFTAETASAAASVAQEVTGDTTQAAAEAAPAMEITEAEAKAAAETARKYSVIGAFILAASLFIAGAGAYWAAGVGGQHRDEGRVFKRFGRWT